MSGKPLSTAQKVQQAAAAAAQAKSRSTGKGGKGTDSELNSRSGGIVAPNNFTSYEREGTGLEYSPAAVLTASFVFIGVVMLMHVVSKFAA